MTIFATYEPKTGVLRRYVDATCTHECTLKETVRADLTDRHVQYFMCAPNDEYRKAK